MHIIFNSIEMRNFMSIGNGYIDLNNQGYVLINGINNNPLDQAKSNGSGKSSAINAVVYALTGQTLSGIKNVVNKYSNDGCKVTLKFSLDNVNYQIDRYKDDSKLGTNLKFFVNGEDKSGKGIRDTEKIIAEYFPDLTDSFIGSVIILGQGLPQRFTNNTPAGRKEVLETLSKSDFMIQDIKDKLSNRKIDLNTQLRTVEDSILSDTAKKGVVESQLQKLNEDKASLIPVDFDADITRYTNDLSKLEEDKLSIDSEMSNLNEQLTKKLNEYHECLSQVSGKLEAEKAFLDETLQPYYTKMSNLRVELNLKEQEVSKLESIIDICPTCGQKLPDVHKVDTTNVKKERDLLIEDLAFAEDAYGKVKQDIDAKMKTLKATLDSDSEKLRQDIEQFKEAVNNKSKQSGDYAREINNIKLQLDKIKLNKENYEKKSKTIDNDITAAENLRTEYEQKILYNNIEKDNIEKHIDVINKMLTLATRDFRGFLLSEVISYIDKKAKEYALDIFNNDNIAFTLDGNNISITYLDKEYESLSGGEKQKVDLIIQFSMRDMLTQFMNFSCNMIALDEVFDGLDSIGCQNVINMIAKRLSDIESVFIITHHASELDIPYDKQIFVIKDERGISEIK